MKKALLIIDAQKAAVVKPEIVQNIEKLQYEYDVVYASKFTKTGYSSYLPEMKAFDEIHLCGFDTDACIYKTALDLIETGIRPIVLKDYCYSANQELHDMGLKLLERNIGKINVR